MKKGILRKRLEKLTNFYFIGGVVFMGAIVFLGFESGKEERMKEEVIEYYDLNGNGKIDSNSKEFYNAKRDLSDFVNKQSKMNYKTINYFNNRDWRNLYEYINLEK